MPQNQERGFPPLPDVAKQILVEIARRNGSTRPKREFNDQGETLYDALARHFQIAEGWQSEYHPSKEATRISKWEIHVQTAVKEPKRIGLVDGSERNVWSLTEEGWREAMATGASLIPEAIQALIENDPEINEDATYSPSAPKYISRDEGGRVVYTSQRLERNARLRTDFLKRHSRSNNGRLPCSICGFDFFHAFGEHGRDFIEVHHVRPLSDGPRRTTTSDLEAVCPNCHRMIHHKKGVVFSIAGLKKLRTSRT